MTANWFTHFAPEWTLLVGACVALLAGAGRKPTNSNAPAWVALFTVLAALVLSATCCTTADSEIVPTLWVNSLTQYARMIALTLGAIMILVNWRQPAALERGEYMAMILFSLTGVLLTASANDWITLFFALELVSVPTYVLVALSRDDARSSEAAVKYFFLGALSAAMLAYGVSFLYGATGTTTIHRFILEGVAESTLHATTAASATAITGFLLFFFGLSFKIAAVPFHAYVADVYEGAASPVSGLLGFVPKFAGFIALIKVLSAWNWSLPTTIVWLIWIVAVLTMTVGNVLALVQTNAKRVLAYSSVAHTGYMLVALLVGPISGQGPLKDGVAALLFYVAVYGVMNLGAFTVLSAFLSGNRELETIEELGGLAKRAPAAALAFAVCVFSLMGFPPTAGFVGKLYIFSSAVSLADADPMQRAMIWLAIIAVANTAVAAAYYLRLVAAAYVGTETAPAMPTGGRAPRLGLILCCLPLLLLFAVPSKLAEDTREASSVLRTMIKTPTARVTSTAPHTDHVSNAHP